MFTRLVLPLMSVFLFSLPLLAQSSKPEPSPQNNVLQTPALRSADPPSDEFQVFHFTPEGRLVDAGSSEFTFRLYTPDGRLM